MVHDVLGFVEEHHRNDLHAMLPSIGRRPHTVALTRLRATWKAGIALCDNKVLERTHNVRRVVFYFISGGLTVTRNEVERLYSRCT